MRVSAAELWLVGIILGLFLLAMLFLACSMNPRELLDCSLFRCCWTRSSNNETRRRGVNPRRVRHDEDDEGVDITFPTINEYIFDSQSGEAGFVAMDDEDDENVAAERRPLTMNHVFPDLLAGEE